MNLTLNLPSTLTHRLLATPGEYRYQVERFGRFSLRYPGIWGYRGELEFMFWVDIGLLSGDSKVHRY